MVTTTWCKGFTTEMLSCQTSSYGHEWESNPPTHETLAKSSFLTIVLCCHISREKDIHIKVTLIVSYLF